MPRTPKKPVTVEYVVECMRGTAVEMARYEGGEIVNLELIKGDPMGESFDLCRVLMRSPGCNERRWRSFARARLVG